MRWYLLVSMASAAESFRSICNSERSAPECSRQRCPAATPQVGQGTEDNCAGVRSFILIGTGCDKKCGKAIRFGTLSGKTVLGRTHVWLGDRGRAPGRRRVQRKRREERAPAAAGAPTRTKAKTPPSEGRRYKDRRVQASCRSPKDGSQLEGAEFEWFGNFLRAVASNLIAKVCVDRLRGKDWPG